MMLRREPEPAVISSRLAPQYDAAGEREPVVMQAQIPALRGFACASSPVGSLFQSMGTSLPWTSRRGSLSFP